MRGIPGSRVHPQVKNVRIIHNGVATVTILWLRTRYHVRDHMSPRDMYIPKYVETFYFINVCD